MGYNHVFQVYAMFGSSFQTVIAFLKYICLEITFFFIVLLDILMS